MEVVDDREKHDWGMVWHVVQLLEDGQKGIVRANTYLSGLQERFGERRGIPGEILTRMQSVGLIKELDDKLINIPNDLTPPEFANKLNSIKEKINTATRNKNLYDQ